MGSGVQVREVWRERPAAGQYNPAREARIAEGLLARAHKMARSHFRSNLDVPVAFQEETSWVVYRMCETFRSFRESTHRPLCRAIKFSVCRAHGVRHEYDRERKRVCPVRHVEPRVLLEPKSRAEWPVY